MTLKPKFLLFFSHFSRININLSVIYFHLLKTRKLKIPNTLQTEHVDSSGRLCSQVQLTFQLYQLTVMSDKPTSADHSLSFTFSLAPCLNCFSLPMFAAFSECCFVTHLLTRTSFACSYNLFWEGACSCCPCLKRYVESFLWKISLNQVVLTEFCITLLLM